VALAKLNCSVASRISWLCAPRKAAGDGPWPLANNAGWAANATLPLIHAPDGEPSLGEDHA
jgi:hypothetical protein